MPLLSLVSGPVAQAAGTGSRCAKAKSKTIAQNRYVRVYRVTGASATKLYACRRASGRRVALDEDSGDETLGSGFSNVRLAGNYVAWKSATTEDPGCKAACPPGTGSGTSITVEIYDTRRGRQRTVFSAEPLGGALVLSRSGAIAWAAQDSSSGPIEIRVSVRKDDDRTIATGNIDPKSLAIELTIISWKCDGVEYFARLR